MQGYDLIKMTKLTGISPAKAKNWTSGRPFTLTPSILQAQGRGSVNVYSIEDVYLMGLANELSGLGFAANPIGKLIETAKTKFATLADMTYLTIWRPTAGGAFKMSEGQDRPAAASLWVTVRVKDMVSAINQKVAKLS